MKSWTRTLNLDDAHSLLALTRPGMAYDRWASACHEALPDLSAARRRELIRILRESFLEWHDHRLLGGLFLEVYADAPAFAQLDLMAVQWALSHPLTVIATEALVVPALESGNPDIPLDALDGLVAEHIDTDSAESLRKTRTTLLGAMEGVGTVVTRGTGQHRSLRASRGQPHPIAFAYLILRDLVDRGIDGMMTTEAVESSLATRLTCCGEDHAERCVDWAVAAGWLRRSDDEVGPVRS